MRTHRPLLDAFQHIDRLSMNEKEYRDWVFSFLRLLLESDRGKGDLSTEALFGTAAASLTGEIVVKETGTAAGLEELSAFAKTHGIAVTEGIRDGDPLTPGAVAIRLTGPLLKLLVLERLALDLLGRMSGITTATKRLQDKIKSTGTRVAATRKTLWGPMDKKAVCLGGGLSHRLGLWQAILMKDNHVAALSLLGAGEPWEEALSRGLIGAQKNGAAFLEIEVESAAQAKKIIALLKKQETPLPFGLLLDNFSPAQVASVVAWLENEKMRENVVLEASGGITEESVIEFARAKPDILSVGSLTHSSKALDFSMRMAP